MKADTVEGWVRVLQEEHRVHVRFPPIELMHARFRWTTEVQRSGRVIMADTFQIAGPTLLEISMDTFLLELKQSLIRLYHAMREYDAA